MRYNVIMTDLLEQAFAAVSRLDPTAQDDIAATVMILVGRNDLPLIELTREEEAAIIISEAAALQGGFAGSEQVAGLMAKYS